MYITDIKNCKDEETALNISNDDLTTLVNTDLNLFPMYGDIKLLKPSERELKEAELEKELNAVRIHEQSTETNPDDKRLLENKFNENVQEFIEKLKMEFPKIRAAMEMVNRSSCLETNNVIELQPDLVETLKECCKNLKIISQVRTLSNYIDIKTHRRSKKSVFHYNILFQFIKDINTIENFEKSDFRLKQQGRKTNTTYEMIKMLHREVLTVLKYSRCL